VLYPCHIALTIGRYSDNYIREPEDIIVVNHWQQPSNAPTVPLVTLYNSLDFHESIAISYCAPSHIGPGQLLRRE